MSIADKLLTIAENEQKVYDAGVKTEVERFWSKFQKNVNEAVYDTETASFTKN